MRGWGWWLVGVSVVGAGCAGTRSARGETEPVDPPPGAARVIAQQEARPEAVPVAERYVDAQLGFELVRPQGSWRLSITNDPGEDGLVVPVTLQHGSGATVVLQIAPAIATPLEYAERLTKGMQRELGAVTGGLEPLGLSADAVGFGFTIDGAVIGRVAVREGGAGNVFMLLATWPTSAPRDVTEGVDAIFASVRPVDPPRPGQHAEAAR